MSAETQHVKPEERLVLPAWLNDLYRAVVLVPRAGAAQVDPGDP